MSTRKPKPRGRSFARGNQAASKGEPRTVAFSCRLPKSTAYKLASIAYGRRSRADVLIELIEEAELRKLASIAYGRGSRQMC